MKNNNKMMMKKKMKMKSNNNRKKTKKKNRNKMRKKRKRNKLNRNSRAINRINRRRNKINNNNPLPNTNRTKRKNSKPNNNNIKRINKMDRNRRRKSKKTTTHIMMMWAPINQFQQNLDQHFLHLLFRLRWWTNQSLELQGHRSGERKEPWKLWQSIRIVKIISNIKRTKVIIQSSIPLEISKTMTIKYRKFNKICKNQIIKTSKQMENGKEFKKYWKD